MGTGHGHVTHSWPMKCEGRFDRGFWERRVLAVLGGILDMPLNFPMGVKKQADSPESPGGHLSTRLRLKLTTNCRAD